MNPLISIAAGVMPELIKLVAGDRAGNFEKTIIDAVSDITGTSDPAQAKAKLDTDPATASALRQRLAQVAIAESRNQLSASERQQQRDADASDQKVRAQLDQFKQNLLNTESARGSLTGLAETKSRVAWTAPILSYIVTIGFFVFLLILVIVYWFRPSPVAADQNNFIIQIINISVGALAAAFATVVNFWLGSSSSSRDQDDTTMSLQRLQAQHNGAVIDAITKRATSAPVVAPETSKLPVAFASPSTHPDVSASDRFKMCLAMILKMEGGYVVDDGGPTNFGVTLATLRNWEDNPSLTAEDVRNLSESTAAEIYRTEYWNRMQCGALPPGLDLEVFDFGVNAGPSRSVKTLQKIVGVTEDGSVGPITLAAVRTFNVKELIDRFSQARLAFYQDLPATDDIYKRGWTSRVSQIEAASLRMTDSPETMVA